LKDQLTLNTQQTKKADSGFNPLDAFVMLRGDAVELMENIDNESVDLILTDPPYFIPARHYATRKQFSRSFADIGLIEYFFRDVFSHFKRILKPTGHLLIFCDGQSYPLFYWHTFLFTKAVRPLIWDKLVSFSGYSWRHQHELILYGEMPEARPIKTGDGDILKHRAVNVNNRLHPAEKPIKLLEEMILKLDSHVIIDTFMGSGSTGVACKNLNRRFIGIEKDEKYFEIAKQRIEAT